MSSLEEQGVTRESLRLCVRLGMYWEVENVLGLDHALSGESRRRRIIDALYPDCALAKSACDDMPSACSVQDALSEAAAIARSANGEIDWMREPLTERERKIRTRYLERFFEQADEDDSDLPLHSLVLESLTLADCRTQRTVASDMRLAVARANAIIDQHRAERDAELFADIAAEIDDGL